MQVLHPPLRATRMTPRFSFPGSVRVFPALLVIGFLLAAGCSAPPSSEALTARRAHLEIANLTDYAWRIAFVAPSPETRAIEVAARATLTLDLAPGDYIIEQRLLGAPASETAARRLPARFEAGETYRWPLATVRSLEGETPRPGQR